LKTIHEMDGLWRIRFLTSHPADMTDELIEAVASLPKVCEHVEIPIQSGDDEILKRMLRRYTIAQYRELVAKIRERIPNVALATDVIVGFPGETEKQFMNTYDLLGEIRFDVVHVAAYSPRPDTAASRLPDDVPPQEKERRRQAVDELQGQIAGEINALLLGQTVKVLVEEQHKGKWRGRTRTNKLVFFEDERIGTGNWPGFGSPGRGRGPCRAVQRYCQAPEIVIKYSWPHITKVAAVSEFAIIARYRSIQSEVTYYPLDVTLSAKIRSIARRRGVSPETLLNLWVQEKLQEASA